MLPPGRAARLAAVREHARRVREVHSRVTHDVTAMVVQADATQFLVDETADRAQAGLRAIAETGRRAIADLRDLIEAPDAAPWQSSGHEAGGPPRPLRRNIYRKLRFFTGNARAARRRTAHRGRIFRRIYPGGKHDVVRIQWTP
ncbi:histidine kinase [Amycolatopsis pigmentata]|uniref:Histidine kinase n=1 Tax=Amycolatopsis pigmentata TaxID=450801 RepID=A0ABW5FS34_9PSEU